MNVYKAFGDTIRHLRTQRNEPLRIVAAALDIDSTLLSKMEHGERFPTRLQLPKFATYFNLAVDDLTALVIADKILWKYGQQAVTLQAVNIVKERIEQTYE
ncbi:MAG TPA: helix-turn-helix transcriptional regulator [Thermoflexia bacterium]|nr:helix-turn-helix transcriptional regulator [Thermoflexia bacterium]